MSSVGERSAIITLRGVKLIESSQSALTLSAPSTTDAPSIRQMAEGRRISSATRQSRPGRTCPPAADRPSRRRAAGTAARNPLRNRPRSRPAAQGSWERIRSGLPEPPSGRGRRQGRFGGRSRSRRGRRFLRDDRGSRGLFRTARRSGRRGGMLSCIGRRRRSGRGCRRRGRGRRWDGAEGAAFCAVEAGAGAGATGVVLRDTGGRTLVSSTQKTAAIATSTTPASKPHNQRGLAFPSRRSELSAIG